jgi:CheY-like chemotaxis protein
MAKQPRPGTILMADDDADDCLLAREALRESGQPHDLRIVRDGQQLLDYLRRQGDYGSSQSSAPRPDLILLDLKMPRKDGREALSELKADPRLRSIPIVVLTTSTARDDIAFCYRMGVNSYITKPATFRGLVDLLSTLSKYWFELVELPAVE